MIFNILLSCLVLLLFVYLYLKWTFTYWKRKGVQYLEPTLPFGTSKELFLQTSSLGETLEKQYNVIRKKGWKYSGTYQFTNPTFVVVDPELIKDILQRDFEYFTDRGMYVNEEKEPLTGHLFSLDGIKWKTIRVKLTPTFTSGKMKQMFNILSATTEGLHLVIEDSLKTNKPLDIKETLARFTTDVISSCAFGLDTSCLKNADNDFRKYEKQFFATNLKAGLRNVLQFTVPHGLLKLLNFKLFDEEVSKFFLDLIYGNLIYRKTNNVTRNDFFQLLLEIQKNDPTFDFRTLAAQAFVFFFAGFETSSTAMTFTLTELCVNEDIQDKLRHEIKTVLNENNNEITYDTIMKMTYLDMVLNESLRKYPPVPFLLRKTNKIYKIKDSNVVLDTGTQVFISVRGIHMDPDYYPNPELFDPERFNHENKTKRPPILHIPFGDGPRNCIGLRFGIMQAKVGLVALLSKYKFTLNEKTKFPVKFKPQSIILTADQDILVNVEKI